MFAFQEILVVQSEFNCGFGPTLVDYFFRTTEQGYIELCKGFDMLDCAALGLVFSPGPPTALGSQGYEEAAPGFLRVPENDLVTVSLGPI